MITTSCVAKMLLLSDRVSSIEPLKLMLNHGDINMAEFRNMNDLTLTSLLLFGSEKKNF